MRPGDSNAYSDTTATAPLRAMGHGLLEGVEKVEVSSMRPCKGYGNEPRASSRGHATRVPGSAALGNRDTTPTPRPRHGKAAIGGLPVAGARGVRGRANPGLRHKRYGVWSCPGLISVVPTGPEKRTAELCDTLCCPVPRQQCRSRL